MNRDKVVIVNEQDAVLGEMEKLAAHEQGILHRAFSVFIFNAQGQMLLQQRASSKYHGASLWTNACCSHPQLNEDVKQAALERLNFEMGLNCEIEQIFSFVYHAKVENNLIEYELDHVYLGITNTPPQPNATEVSNTKWMDCNELLQAIDIYPDEYTVWFKMVVNKVLEYLPTYNN